MNDILANLILIGVGAIIIHSIYLAIVNRKNKIKIEPASETTIVVNEIIEHDDGTYSLDLEYRIRGEYEPVQIYKTANTREEIENIQARKLNEIYKAQAQERKEAAKSIEKGAVVLIILIIISILL